MNTLVSFSVAKKAGAQGLPLMRLQATDIFEILHLDLCSQARDFAMSNFMERLRTFRTGSWVRPISKNCVSSDAHSWMVASVFYPLPAVLASEGWLHWGKTINRKTTFSRFLEKSCPVQHIQWVFLGRCFSVLLSRTTVRSREVLILLFLSRRDHSAPPVLGSQTCARGSAWHSVGRTLTILGVLARCADCTNVHLARLIAGVQRARLDVHDISLASGSADVLDYEVSRSQRVLQWNGQPDIT